MPPANPHTSPVTAPPGPVSGLYQQNQLCHYMTVGSLFPVHEDFRRWILGQVAAFLTAPLPQGLKQVPICSDLHHKSHQGSPRIPEWAVHLSRDPDPWDRTGDPAAAQISQRSQPKACFMSPVPFDFFDWWRRLQQVLRPMESSRQYGR